jgi:hypothetical protein
MRWRSDQAQGESSMEPQEIIATAESGSYPPNWHVWTLRRGLVLREVAWQTFVAVIGFILLIYGLAVTIPDNFTQGSLKAAFTISLLLLFAIMAFGGLALVLGDINRLRLAGRYLLVMTPDDFIKRTPRSVTHVPMEYVTDIRLVGVKVSNSPDGGLPRVAPPVSFNWILGVFSLRRTPRQQAKLSFVDERDKKTVVVGQDHAFEDLGALEYVLRIYVGDKERALRAARSRR